MSPRSSNQRSRRSAPAELDVYVTLLFISASSLLVGAIFLYMEVASYGFGTASL